MHPLPIINCRFMEWFPSAIEVVAFTPNGKYLAVAHQNAEIFIYSTNDWHICGVLPGDANASIRNIIWLKKDEENSINLFDYYLISTGLDSRITLWNLNNLKKITTVASYGQAIFDATLSPDKQYVATACDDGTIRIYNLKDEELQLHKTMQKHSGRLLSVCWYSDTILFGGTATSTIHRYQLKGGYSDAKLELDKTVTAKGQKVQKPVLVWSIVALKSFGLIVTGDSSGKVTFWDVNTCTYVHQFHEHQADVLSLAVAHNEMSIISCGVDSRVTVYSMSHSNGSWYVMGYKYPHSHDIRSTSVSPSGLIATGGADTTLCILQSGAAISDLTLRPLRPSIVPPNASQWISVSPLEKLFLYQRRDMVELWYMMENERCDVPKPVKVGEIHLKDTGDIICSDMTMDGQLIAVGSVNGIRLFGIDLNELEIGEVKCSALQHLEAYTIKFLNNDTILVSIEEKQNVMKESSCFAIMIYDIWRMKETAVFGGLKYPVRCIETANDGQYMVTIDSGGRANVYAVDTLKHLIQLPSFNEEERCVAVAFHPTDNEIAVFGSSCSYYIFDVNHLCIKQNVLSSRGISKIPSFYLSASDGPILKAIWIERKSDVDEEVTSYLICQMASCLCTINLRGSDAESIWTESEDRISLSKRQKSMDGRSCSTLRYLAVGERYIPKSLRRMLEKKNERNNNKENIQSNEDVLQNSTSIGASDLSKEMNVNDRLVDDTYSDSPTVQSNGKPLTYSKKGLSDTSSIQYSLTSSVAHSTQQRYAVDRRFKYLIGLIPSTQLELSGSLHSLCKKSAYNHREGSRHKFDKKCNGNIGGVNGCESKEVLKITSKFDSYLFAFCVSPDTINAKLPNVFNAKRYGM